MSVTLFSLIILKCALTDFFFFSNSQFTKMAACNQGLPVQREDSINQTEFLHCSICDEPYDDNNHKAKLLSCHHTFCSHCLSELSKRQDNPNVVPCPNCRHETQLPENGIPGLQRNFYIGNRQKTKLQVVDSCHKHCNQLMSFFCDTCKMKICRDCTVLDHSVTDGHVIMDLPDAEVSHRQALSQQIDERRILLTTIRGNMEKLEQEMALLIATQQTTREDIEEFICNVHKKVDERKQQLIKSNEKIFYDAQANLLSILKTSQETADTINKELDKCESINKDGCLDEVISINNKLLGMTEKMQPRFDSGNTCISFDPKKGTEAFKNALCNLAKIDFKSFWPAKVEFKSKEARVGQKAEMRFQLFSHHGEPVLCNHSHFTAEITDPKGTNITSVLTTTEHRHMVAFTPQMSGLHKIKLSGIFPGLQLTNQVQISVSSKNSALKFDEMIQWPWPPRTWQCLFVIILLFILVDIYIVMSRWSFHQVVTCQMLGIFWNPRWPLRNSCLEIWWNSLGPNSI